ncbi:MAG: aminotransferase class V-fold PLP-dependent enzyme [Alphaproteobacteria bacterium]|nr:aminotransferase class V-fold PLP-dependent enzyme [Alphaproteobacteria bacterium]
MSNPSPLDDSPAARRPEYGAAALDAFALVRELLHLNHGSYGAVPKRVLAAQDSVGREIESDPTGFFQNRYPQRVREAAAVAARCFGGAAEDWVFCENATAAVNSVLASLPFRAGDEILTTSHAYGAVLKAMRLWAERRSARTKVAEIPTVVESDAQVIEAVAKAFTAATRLLVIDHITSPTAAIFPAREIVEHAHNAGIPVLVDGAHVPGHLPLDVRQIGADWYTGNAHKWLFAPRGCGLLWTAPKWQDITRPAVLSHGTDAGYTAAFDWVGTRDVSPWLTLPEAVNAHADFGGPALMSRNRALAAEAGTLLAARTGGTLTAPEAMRGAMASICLPGSATMDDATRLRHRLRDRGFVVWANPFQSQLCLRISVQIYSQLSDYERLADALRA